MQRALQRSVSSRVGEEGRHIACETSARKTVKPAVKGRMHAAVSQDWNLGSHNLNAAGDQSRIFIIDLSQAIEDQIRVAGGFNSHRKTRT